MTVQQRLSSLASQVRPPSQEAGFEVTSTDGGVSGQRPPVPQSGSKDLQSERNAASFNAREMNYYIHGGKHVVEVREKILLQFERDPTFAVADIYDLTKNEHRKRAMTRLRSMTHHIWNEPEQDFTLRILLLILVDPGFLTKMAVHYGLFLNTILGQGTPEQVNYWLGHGVADFKGAVGCYAMTELGHGSNVAALETTAIFDRETDEFVIHTPTLTATKWWIGGAAESATHTTAFANLTVDGKKYGVRPFVVQLRDPETYKLMPGITIGDCGMKMGRNVIDNGWIQFTYVRIPRTNLLMKYTKVTRDGKVSEPPIAQLAYGSLINGRATIARESAECAKKALTIAIRYACVRRQFGGSEASGKLETKLMDYQTHQQRLIPLLAFTYALAFGAMEINKIYIETMDMLQKTKPGDPQMQQALATLKETHATSAGLKAYFTWSTLQLIENCRQSLGGLGYSSYAGLATLFQDFAVQCTWEGDNTVLTLQTGRYLISCVQSRGKKKLPAGVDYLNKLPQILTVTCAHSDLSDLNCIAEAFDVTCANYAVRATKAFEELLKKGLSEDDAQQQCGLEKFAAAKLHCIGYLFHRFKDACLHAPSGLRPILTDLCKLYGLMAIKEDAGPFLQYGYFKPAQLVLIDKKITDLYTKLRPQVVPLTDAFGLSDYAINSPLGCADGDIYRRMFEKVKETHPYQGTHPYFEELLKPVLFRKENTREPIKLDE